MKIIGALQKAVKTLDVEEWKDIGKMMYACVTVLDLEWSDAYNMANAVLSEDYTLETQQVPDMTKKEDGTWDADCEMITEERLGCCIRYDFTKSKSLERIRN